jgi:hypothetical protein
MVIIGSISFTSRDGFRRLSWFFSECKPTRSNPQRAGKPTDCVESWLIDVLLDPADRRDADHRFLSQVLLGPAQALAAPLQSLAHSQHRLLRFFTDSNCIIIE